MEDSKQAETGNKNRKLIKPLLKIDNLEAFYGDAQVLDRVFLTVGRNEIVAVLGSNGAGKTTLLKTMTGLLSIRKGDVFFNGESIANVSAHKIIHKGIACVPEGRQLFDKMTVSDNLLLGTYCLRKNDRKKMMGTRLDVIYNLFPVLKDRVNQLSETLSGGEQQMLALGRALMSDPSFLVLDEPSLGISPMLVKEMMMVLKQICNELEISILLVEQNARAAMKIAEYIYIIERGEVTLEGITENVMGEEKIQSAYLGA